MTPITGKFPHVGAVYALVNSKTGGRYVGSAIDLQRRMQKHRRQLKTGKHFNRALLAAVRADGIEVLSVEVLETVKEPGHLTAREQCFIDALEPEYNSRAKARSNFGVRLSNETRTKIREIQQRPEIRSAKSAAARQLWQNTSFRQESSERTRRQWQDEDFRSRKSEQSRRQWDDPKYRAAESAKAVAQFRGVPKSPEHRAKIAAALRGKIRSPEHCANISAAKRARNAAKRVEEDAS